MLEMLFPILCLGQTTDEFGVLRVDAAGASKSTSLTLPGSILKPQGAKATDSKFFAVGGAQPLRFIFGADVDGDMQDEIAVLTEFISGESGYRLTVHARPEHLFDDVSAPTMRSRKGEIGARKLFGAIVAADSVNLDGTGADEIALVRKTENGNQRLEIYRLPDKKGFIEPALASFSDLGNVAVDAVLDVTGFDIDTDNKDEIALLRRDSLGQLRVDLLRSPQSPGDAVKILVASARDEQKNGAIIGIDSIDANSDGRDELLVLHAPIQELSKLEIFTSPTGPSDTLQPLAKTEPIWLANSPNAPLFDAFALRGVSPKVDATGALPPEAMLENEFTCWFEHDIPGGYLGTTHVALIPVIGAIGKFNPTSKDFSITLPNGANLTGKFNTVNDTLLPNGETFEIPDAALSESMLLLNPNVANVDVYGPVLVIQGTYSGQMTGITGSKSVTNGKFSFVSIPK